jgi:hypothetical protein
MNCSPANRPNPKTTPRDFRGYDPQIPDGLKQIVLTALQIDPLRRFQTAGEMGTALQNWAWMRPAPAGSGWRGRPTNLHPLLSCFLPNCGAVPRTDRALYCGKVSHHDSHRDAACAAAQRAADAAVLAKGRKPAGPHRSRYGYFSRCRLSRLRHGTLCVAPPRRHQARWHAFLPDGAANAQPNARRWFAVSSNATVPLQDGARLEFADLGVHFIIRPVVQNNCRAAMKNGVLA